ncbi:response regulator [Actinospongicola halichondriae]|uniref:response regulator n=1 Tax=Actinospongicola halichondriae TaxID=3236844 RepID=UPI003D401B65
MLIAVSPLPRVLYVEDERPLHGLIEFWLTEAGFTVELALDGAEALAMIRDDPPDLVITDAMMPNLSGDELVEILKSDPDLAQIPVVMATAAASPFRVQKMLERGCTAVLRKPLDEQSFVRAALDALGLD